MTPELVSGTTELQPAEEEDLVTLEIDFTAAATEGLKVKNDYTKDTVEEFTVGEVTFSYLNSYQGSYSGAYYFMMNSKGYSSAAMLANKTTFGVIRAVEITTTSSASDKAQYAVRVGESAMTTADVTGAETVAKDTTKTFTFADNTNATYFAISSTTVANAQIAKLVVKYLPVA